MTDPKKTTKKPEDGVTVDLGMGGLFKGLGNLLDMVSSLVETAEANGGQTNSTGEFKVKGMGEKARGVYGFSVHTDIAGIPRVEHFGNIRSTEAGPEVAEVREPLVDVFNEATEFVITAELPGVSEDEIQVDVQGDVLSMQTTGERKYAKEILLPADVDPASLKKVYKNGILELRLSKK